MGRSSSDKKTKSERAGLVFPVGRIARHLKTGRYAKRIAGGAPIFMAGVLQYLTQEVLQLAGDIANENERSRITPRYVQLAVRTDEELNKFLGNVIIASGGVCGDSMAAHGSSSSSSSVPKNILKSSSHSKGKKDEKPAPVDEDEDEDDDDATAPPEEEDDDEEDTPIKRPPPDDDEDNNEGMAKQSPSRDADDEPAHPDSQEYD